MICLHFTLNISAYGIFLLPHAKCALSLGKIPFYGTSSCQHYKLEDYFLCSALIEERNELGEGPLKKMQRLSLHTAGQLNVLRISVHRTSLMCDKLELVSTALLPRRGGRRNRNLLMPKVS